MLPVDSQITFLYVTDIERSAAFYGGALGLPLVLDQGLCRIYRVAAAAYVGVCQRPRTDSEPKYGLILTLVTDDVDGWYAALLAKGVAFEKPPAHNPDYHIYHAFLRDPDGYLIEIQRFDDPHWADSVR
jgi:catechol 2,3-dioxygenase-like lactoylglutathione lyase family enzyme